MGLDTQQWILIAIYFIGLFFVHRALNNRERKKYIAEDKEYHDSQKEILHRDDQSTLFKAFLFHCKVSRNFEMNFCKHNDLVPFTKHSIVVYNDYCNKTPINELITNAFTWTNTREGESVWTSLDAYWKSCDKTLPFPKYIDQEIANTFKVKYYKD